MVDLPVSAYMPDKTTARRLQAVLMHPLEDLDTRGDRHADTHRSRLESQESDRQSSGLHWTDMALNIVN